MIKYSKESITNEKLSKLFTSPLIADNLKNIIDGEGIPKQLIDDSLALR